MFLQGFKCGDSVGEGGPAADFGAEVLGFLLWGFRERERSCEGFVGEGEELVVAERGLGTLNVPFESLEDGDSVEFIVDVGVRGRQKGKERL